MSRELDDWADAARYHVSGGVGADRYWLPDRRVQCEGIRLDWTGTGRQAAVAVSRFRAEPGRDVRGALAFRLEEAAAALRRGDLTGEQTVERVLWDLAGYCQAGQTPPAAIPVTARAITDEEAEAPE